MFSMQGIKFGQRPFLVIFSLCMRVISELQIDGWWAVDKVEFFPAQNSKCRVSNFEVTFKLYA